jgi:hypothetical protein
MRETAGLLLAVAAAEKLLGNLIIIIKIIIASPFSRGGSFERHGIDSSLATA